MLFNPLYTTANQTSLLSMAWTHPASTPRRRLSRLHKRELIADKETSLRAVVSSSQAIASNA